MGAIDVEGFELEIGRRQANRAVGDLVEALSRLFNVKAV